METFAGPSFHSARWDHSVDLKGKRVAVIGTGASAAQFIPVIAEQASPSSTIFQRTPNWFVPVPTYHDDVPAGPAVALHARAVLRALVPLLDVLEHDRRPAARRHRRPELAAPGPHPSARRTTRSACCSRMYMQAQYRRPPRPRREGHARSTRPPRSASSSTTASGRRRLKRDNVAPHHRPHREITPTGVVTDDGAEHAADVIIYGTGFQASRFLTPMQVTGRNGIDLNEQWDGDARAYMGITVPNFPNFFLLYGPNTNIVVNGSIIYFSECEVQYVMGCLRMLADRRGARARLQARRPRRATTAASTPRNRMRTWGASDVNSWYKNDTATSRRTGPST